MSHLVLHIGTHKTGTTTIQDCFWKNAPLLERSGIIYPRLSYRFAGHHGLIAEQVSLPAQYFLKEGGFDTLRKIARLYERHDTTVFLSSEEFSRADLTKSVNFRAVRDCFAGFDRVSVLCFLRPQWRFLQSIYLEISRTRNPRRLPDFVQEAVESGMCQGLFLDYVALLDWLSDAFEPSEIRLVDFESARATTGGLIDAALAASGSRLTHQDLQAAHRVHSNPSSDALSQWMANLVAEPYRAPEQLRSLIEGVRETKGITSCLTRREIVEFKSHFADSNAELERRRQKVQSEFRLTDPVVPTSAQFREDVTVEDWLRISQCLGGKVFPEIKRT